MNPTQLQTGSASRSRKISARQSDTDITVRLPENERHTSTLLLQHLHLPSVVFFPLAPSSYRHYGRRADTMDSQADADASGFASPLLRPRSNTRLSSVQKSARSTQKKRQPSPRLPRSTPKKTRRSPKPTPGANPAPVRVESAQLETCWKTYDTANVRVCPAGRAFPAPKASQRVKSLWQFIVCVADEKHDGVPRDQLTRDHAKGFYCLSCSTELPIKKGKSVVGPHMKKVHPDDLRAFEDKERHQNEIEASRKLTDVFVPSGDSEQSYFNSILAEWVGTSLRPISIVEDAEFVKAIRFANAAKTQLSVPSRQTVGEGVHTKASQCRLSLRLRLSDDDECFFFSLSSDIWTSLQHESFISLTLHYVDSKFEIHSWTLEVTEIPGKRDGDAIAAVLARCFSWWRLDPKRCVIFLRDGASNMVKACESLGLRHMSCSAHSLHLVVGGALLIKSNERNSMVVVSASQSTGDAGDSENTRQGSNRSEAAAAFVDSSTSSSVNLRRMSWMDDQLERLEQSDDAQKVDSLYESFEWISDADIDDLSNMVATFVNAVEKSASANVKSNDMEDVRKVVLQFRKLSTYFHHSQKGSNRLAKLQSDKKRPLEILNDCPTRWNSTFTMLQRFMELQVTLHKLFFYLETPVGKREFDDRAMKNLTLPTSEQWLTIQCLVVLLAPFSVASDQRGAESHPTLVALYFVIASLKAVLRNDKMFADLIKAVQTESYAHEVHAKMQSVRKTILALLDKRFDSSIENEILWISLLDPYTTNLKLYTTFQFENAKERLLEEMLDAKRAAVGASCEPQQPSFQSPEKVINDPKEMVRRQMQELRYAPKRNRPAQGTSDEALMDICRREFTRYIELSGEASVTQGETSQPSALAWWKTNHADLPILSPLARKWLGCIASSVPSERAFSTAGNTITKRRGALKADTVRDIIFLAENATCS